MFTVQSAERGGESHSKDTPTETTKFTLDFPPPMQTRQKVEQVKAYFSAAEIPTAHSVKL